MDKIKLIQIGQSILVVVILMGGISLLGDLPDSASADQLSVLAWTKLVSIVVILSGVWSVRKLEKMINKLNSKQ